MGYKLTEKALREMGKILGWQHRERNAASADMLENLLFEAFDRLGSGRALGHRRPEITTKNLLFYNAGPYLIVFRERENTLQILHVVHGSRDLAKLI